MNNVSCYLKKRKKKEENKPKASRRKETIKIRPERNKIVNKKNNRENQWNKRPVPWKCNQIDNSLANWQRHKLLLSGIKQGFMTNPTDIRRIVRKYYEQLPARLLCPWNSPGRNTGVGSHSLLQGIVPLRVWTWVSCIAGRSFTVCATRQAHEQMHTNKFGNGSIPLKVKCHNSPNMK